jgi:hypothetical protein
VSETVVTAAVRPERSFAVYKACRCGRSYTREEWAALKLVGPYDDGFLVLEMRNCACGSTISVRQGPSAAMRANVAALSYEHLVEELDMVADYEPDLAHWLREVASSRHRTVEFMGSSRAPSTAELRAMLVRELEDDHGG